jgi:hypothetical protein
MRAAATILSLDRDGKASLLIIRNNCPKMM